MLKTKNFNSITKKAKKLGLTIKAWIILSIPCTIIFFLVSMLYSIILFIILYFALIIIEYIDDDAIDILFTNSILNIKDKLYV